MPAAREARDGSLLGLLDAHERAPYGGTVWRVVKENREPLLAGTPSGRWDDGTFEVLYTCEASDGALAEIHFHLTRGQPVIPSRMVFRLYEISLRLERSLVLGEQDFEGLGIDSHGYRGLLYRRTQEVGEIAHFLDFDGLVVPSARWPCRNVVVFDDRISPDALALVRDHGPIDWRAFETRTKG